ncbi:MAG: ABC transporter ATP-binding protein [Ignavibacteria bacterium]|nr:ABC transporter ATP-binding protein [Ignavibacteria bacterium]
MEKVIEITGLTKKYRQLTAVNNLTLNVYKGDVFGFLGPNGAGKSTTIRMLLSLIKPTSGSVKLFGSELQTHREAVLRRVGAIVEKPDFYGYLTAYANLEIFGKLAGADVSRKHILETLELVGLDKRYNSKVKTFSHGMKQRLGIAQTLLHDPELIILDEPTTGLDPQGMKDVRDLILYLSKERNKTVFLSSHILHEVELIANRMIIINKGSTIIEGSVSELLNASKVRVTIEVNDIETASAIIKKSEFAASLEAITQNCLQLFLERSAIAQVNKLLVTGGVQVFSLIPANSLEEYFLKLTEGVAA